jgi:tetratricopeptide (TPR) repeat protein
MRIIFTVVLGLTLGRAALAQQTCMSGAKDMGKMAMAGDATPPEKLAPPVAMSGIGNSFMTISTANPEAQRWFNQGLNLTHDFWDYEASRAFEQAVRLDPNCAICYWGVAHAESFRGENTKWGGAALDQAAKLAKHHASPAEKLYIKAAVVAQQDKESGKGKSSAGPNTSTHAVSRETKVLRKLVQMEPGDVQARIFLAESLMDGFDKKTGEANKGTQEGQAILKQLLVEHPDDTAANHYWIHAVEPSLHPEWALDSARKLGPLTYSSGHMVHMPGHIFFRTGDYETARLSFENSMHVDEEYMKTQKVSVDDDWNYVHNLMYLIADLLEAGRIAEATQMSAKLDVARGHRVTTMYQFSTRDGITRLNPQLPVALRAADWKAATAMLEKSSPDAALVNLIGLKTSLLDYTRGMQALQNVDVAGAEKLSKDLDARMLAKPAEKPMSMPGMAVGPIDADAGPLHNVMDVAAMELRASLLMAQDKVTDADARFVKASEAEVALGYREPPALIRPVQETRADALMKAGKFAEARLAYGQALKDRPNSGYPLFGIAQADAEAKNDSAAMADYGALIKAWAKADQDLPQLTAAREWLVLHGTVLAKAAAQ